MAWVLPGFSVWIVDRSADWEWRPDAFDVELRLLSLIVICRLVGGPREETIFLLTNPSQALTTSSIVGRSLGFAFQHFSMDSHISAVTCSLAGLFPLAIWMMTDSFLMSPNGAFPENTSTASIANANMSAGLDAVMGLELALLGGSVISGASHREDPATPGVAAIVRIWVEIIGLRP